MCFKGGLSMNAKNDLESTLDRPEISCATCKACCCQLEVILMGDDDVPAKFSTEDQWGGSVM